MRIVLVLVGVALLAGCGGSSGGRPDVVAAFYPIAFAAGQIGGPALRVGNLTPPGVEPHDLELTPREVGRIHDAKVVLYLGEGFQPAVAAAARDSSGRAIDLLGGLRLRKSAQEGLKLDPHVWLDPVLFERFANRIGAALHRPAAARRFDARLRALDAEYRRGLARCTRREIVTSHAAFAYLGRRYGLRQVSLTGIDPQSEPSPRALARVIELVRRTHATTIFFEKLISPRLADTVARATGARTAVLDPIEGLTKDEQAHGATYFSVMRTNLAALRTALACR
jgi:zinc transport system substrate-binding protein